MISVQDLIENVGFEPEEVFLEDGDKTVRVDYRLLNERFGRPLESFLELVPVDGHVYFVNHVWKNETDLHCDTSLLDLLKRVHEEHFGLSSQKPASYLLMVQNALEDLRFGDENGILELVSIIEANEE